MRGLTYIISAFAAVLLAVGCQQQYTTYSDAEYISFSDTVSTNIVLADGGYFKVPVTSTVVRDYDRTIAVEIIDEGSTAIEGVHYRLKSNTLTIPAGELVANVEVQGIFESFEVGKALHFTLKLVIPDELRWDGLYADWTRVVMYKSCPFDLNDFTGWCVVTSTFLADYPGAENTSLQRLIQSSVDPSKENTVILHDFLFTGYDVSIQFHPENPAEPLITMEEGQVISDEMSIFGISYGDNKIRIDCSPYSVSSFNTCQTFVSLWIYAYVEDLGEMYGTIGEFYNVIEWVSDEEADRLQREEGF